MSSLEIILICVGIILTMLGLLCILYMTYEYRLGLSSISNKKLFACGTLFIVGMILFYGTSALVQIGLI